MSAFRTSLSRVRDWLRSRRLDDDLRQEIASHLDECVDDYVRQGLTPADARRAALRDFGGVAATEEAHRDLRSIAWLDAAARDLRHAGRSLRRQPGFTLTVLIVLAICIGAATSGLTLLNAVVLRPLPYAHANRLVVITHDAPGLQLNGAGISGSVYDHYLSRARSVEALGVYEERTLTLRTGDGAERVPAAYASASFFQVLGATPLHGRLFTDADAAPGYSSMKWTIPVLISQRLWIDRFGGDPQIVGRVITLSENRRVVLGVLPAGFAFPRPETAVWMLVQPARGRGEFPGDFGWNAVGRLRVDITHAAAQAELTAVVPAMAGRYSGATSERLAQARLHPVVTPLKAAIIGDAASALWPLFGGMIILLLIAGFNVGGLFLVRAAHRQREVAIRRALGAGIGAVRRLFFLEALLLTTAAAACGLAIAATLLRVVTRLPIALPRAEEVLLDAAPIAFAAGCAIVAAALFSLLAVPHGRRESPDGLGAGGLRTTGGRRDRRVRHVLVVAQVMLALAMLSASGLMVRTYRNLTRVDLGFRPDRLLTVEASLANRRSAQHASIFTDLVTRLRQLPGVEQASAVSTLPLTPNEYRFPFEPSGAPVAFKFFLPGYFETMEIPILAGRSLAFGEAVTMADPVVVSDALARRLQADGRVLGQSIRRLNEDGTVVEMGNPQTRAVEPVPPFAIAGIAGAVRETSLRSEPTEVVYIPVRDPAVERSLVPMNMALVIRMRPGSSAAGGPLELAATVRREIQAAAPDISIGRVRTMDSIVSAARATETFVGALLLAAAGVSALLGIVGVYGSVAHVARYRAREIGIRIALGARTSEVLRTVAAGTMCAAAAGIVLGLGMTLLSTRALQTLLYGVDSADPVVLLSMAAVLLAAAAGAALLAAWRGARADPLIALRAE